MMPKLEDEHGFKLCVHERDFELGKEIRENITMAVNSSRRTTVVLTPEYAKSFRRNVEYLEATVKAFNDRANYIMVVLLKEVEHKNLNSILKLYFETNTYVSILDNWLWKKMVYAMPRLPIALLKAQQNDPNNMDLAELGGAIGGNNEDDLQPLNGFEQNESV